MSEWAKRHSGELIFGLSLLVIALVLANLWKYGWLSADWLKNQKDAFAALSSIFTVIVLAAGSVFSYYRFFRGRTLSLRADLDIEITVHDSGDDYFLHSISVTSKNIGTSTIWNPSPYIDIRIHHSKDADSILVINQWDQEPFSSDDESTVPVIESLETVMFFAQTKVSKTAYAVTYKAAVRSDSGHTWHVAKTVSNQLQKA